MLETITNMYEMRPKELTRFVKFAIVGAFGAVIDFGLLNLLRGFFGWPFSAISPGTGCGPFPNPGPAKNGPNYPSSL